MRNQSDGVKMNYRLGFMFAVIGLLSGCGSSENASSDETVAAPAAPIVPTKPARNYTEEENGTYFYIAAVSDEDRQKGVAAGEVIGYRYLGLNDKQQHTLQLVAETSNATMKAYCSDPCAIIKFENGDRISFNPSSIIGAAFQDAINGHLIPFKEQPKPVAKSYPQTVSSVPAAFRGAWDEITNDNCEAREPRFIIEGAKFYNFEVEWDVTKVVLLSDNEIDIHTSTLDDGTQYDEVWEFKLADKGKALTSRKAGGSYFRRCKG